MRSISGARNRIVLVLASLLALLAAAWLAAAALDVTARWPQAGTILPPAGSTLGSLAAALGQWRLPVAVAATVLALVGGIWLLIRQIPSRTAAAPLRFSDGGTQTLGSVEPAVLERALTEHVEGLSGVLDASVHLTGSTTDPWVQASATIAETAETGWAAQAVRELLAQDIRTVLGVDARQVDLLIHLRSSAAPSRAVIGTESSGPPERRETPAPMTTAQA